MAVYPTCPILQVFFRFHLDNFSHHWPVFPTASPLFNHCHKSVLIIHNSYLNQSKVTTSKKPQEKVYHHIGSKLSLLYLALTGGLDIKVPWFNPWPCSCVLHN